MMRAMAAERATRAANAEARMGRFHDRHAGITAAAFARGRVEDGRASYQVLAELAARRERVLDLGCGDGELLVRLQRRGAVAIGVDRSAAEVALARRRGALAVCGDARRLPVADATMSLVVSHLAFSVMEGVEEIAGEIDRVLVPGGRFAAVVGGGPVAMIPEGERDDVFEEFLRQLGAALGGRPRTRFGEVRAGREEGWKALFGERGYAVQWQRHQLDLSGSVEEVWETLGTVYDALLLGERERGRLGEEFRGWCRARYRGGDEHGEARGDARRVPLAIVLWSALATKPG